MRHALYILQSVGLLTALLGALAVACALGTVYDHAPQEGPVLVTGSVG